MRNLFSQLWNDDAGIVGLEYLILATILGLGLIVGITTFTAAMNSEFAELSQAVLALDQGYTSSGFSSCVATKTGSSATDSDDTISVTNVPDAIPATIEDDPCV